MIRKNGTVKVSQIFKVRAHISTRKKGGGFDQTYYQEKVIIANINTAMGYYRKFLKEVEFDLSFNGDTKVAECAVFVPHIHEDGDLAYWPENGHYIELFTHNKR